MAARAHRKLLIFTQVQTVEEPVLELEVPVADSTTMHVTHDAEHLPQELRGSRFGEGRSYPGSCSFVDGLEELAAGAQIRD